MIKTSKALLSPAALRRQARERWATARRVEAEFARQLTKVAFNVNRIVERAARAGGELFDTGTLIVALEKYSAQLTPWAVAAATKMQSEVARRDAAAWSELGKRVGRALRKEIATAPVGAELRKLLAEQVYYIKSIPLDAARRVHKLTLQNLTEGKRAAVVAEQIAYSGQVSLSKARLIARTETARTASLLTQVRAEHVSSPGYVWRTAEDESVRPLHKKLNGKFFAWSAPPVSGENGERAHAGQIYNCRCYAEVVLPEKEKAA